MIIADEDRIQKIRELVFLGWIDLENARKMINPEDFKKYRASRSHAIMAELVTNRKQIHALKVAQTELHIELDELSSFYDEEGI